MGEMMKNKVLDLLPFLLIGDLVLPFLLAPTYRGYNHLMQVMSFEEIVFSSLVSPTGNKPDKIQAPMA